MLASVLHNKIAVQVSINIMWTFVGMRRFIANNALLFEKVSDIDREEDTGVPRQVHHPGW